MAVMAGVTLLVGTQRGLFRLASDAGRGRWAQEGPLIPGYEVYHAVLDPREPLGGYAAVRHEVWGTHIHRTEDGGRTWRAVGSRPSFPDSEERQVRAIWHLAPGATAEPGTWYAGVQPAALFVSRDHCETWTLVEGLEPHAAAGTWQPAKGGLALHSIQVDPHDGERIFVAVSAGGSYRSTDGGRSWAAVNRGVRADFLPDPHPESGQCVHSLRLHHGLPTRLYQQNHCGTYRSDDAGDSWVEITAGLPSDFGYVIGLDPRDPDRCWVVPEQSSHLRTVCEGRLRVYETRDGGSTWLPREEGLPTENVWVTVLREALATDGLEPCGVYLGTSSGHLFASAGGVRWSRIAEFLPKVLSVEAMSPTD
jgi:photosystem II stability/assembly factor-like uncharacterized protein